MSDGDEFDRWYALYPHKVAKGAARRAFARARTLASLDDLVGGLDRYKKSKPAHIEWCHPATWLNGERWLDEPASENGKTGIIAAADRILDKMRAFDRAPNVRDGTSAPVVRLLPKGRGE